MFEWDDTKRLINLEEYHLDFLDARLFFDGRATITSESESPIETRNLTTAVIDGRFYTVV
ncbi:MAG: hypothetical protein ACRERU_01245 [Methylococcales bacterium]